MNKGQLRTWNNEKGYGFIHCDSTLQDVFIHISSLKSMSRKPKVGDFIYFEIDKKNDGKIAAKNCRIEGAIALKRPPHRKVKVENNSSFMGKHLIFFFILIMLIAGYQYFFSRPIVDQNLDTSVKSAPSLQFENTHKSSTFSCDGRQYCSQMNSREEAVFFIQHCPNTKMDGDNDGRPCENDTRF